MGLIEIADFTAQGWKDPAIGAERSRWCCERLEHGDILVLPQFPVISEQDRGFLTGVRQAGSSLIKNISYEPANGRLRGYARSATDAPMLERVLRGYSELTHALIAQLLSPYAAALQIDFTSFRPLEEQGRPLRGRSRNDLIHVDAFPTRPARGRRILRFFTNAHPTKPRVWNTSQTFDDLAASMALVAGLAWASRRFLGSSVGALRALIAALLGFVAALLLGLFVAFEVSRQLFRWEPEAKVPRNAKLWVLAALVPFLVFGAWESTTGNRLNRIQQNFQTLSRRAMSVPAPPER